MSMAYTIGEEIKWGVVWEIFVGWGKTYSSAAPGDRMTFAIDQEMMTW